MNVWEIIQSETDKTHAHSFICLKQTQDSYKVSAKHKPFKLQRKKPSQQLILQKHEFNLLGTTEAGGIG